MASGDLQPPFRPVIPLAMARRSVVRCLGVAASLLLAGCEPAVVQKSFKLVERWSSRWCADRTHDAMDGCKTSDGINALVGSVGALRDGDGRPPMRIDRSAATRACIDADPAAIATLDRLLERGAKVVLRGEQIEHYSARTQPRDGEKDYHLVRCQYRFVVLEGPRKVFAQEEPR